ncbi:hypothetical protein QYE76_050609 [Lolium multiflorum]|uniref:TF-B3 domain-containing protein n=1 Tax=Lolium multiflorum TaxID=4521 RepID=A0AAD8SR89_LOLMU|nr:hypothetical protein QYE76_050609 [Lolium multiflorum]
MENYSLLMGAAAVMKMAVEMAAVSMEKPWALPRSAVQEQRLCPPDLGFAMAAARMVSRIVALCSTLAPESLVLRRTTLLHQQPSRGLHLLLWCNWWVQFQEIDNEIVIFLGWKSFLWKHELKVNDILVFKLQHCGFKVKIFSAASPLRNPTKEIFSELDKINAQGLIFPRSFQKTKGDTKWGHEVATPQGGAAKEGPRSPMVWAPRCPPALPFHLLKLSVAKTLVPRATIRKSSRDAAAANPISGIRRSPPAPERGIITGGLYITMPASGLMHE